MKVCDIISANYQEIQRISRQWAQGDGDDLCQDICLQLLTTPEEKIRAIYEAGKLMSYVRQIVYLQVHQSRSPFNTTYRNKQDELSELLRQDDDWLMKLEVNEILSHLSALDTKILTIFAEDKNISNIARRTCINRETLNRLLKQAQHNAQNI